MKIDEVVTVGQYQRKQKYYIEKFHKEGDIELYSSTTENPKYIDELGCSYIGCLLPKGHSFVLNEDIYVEMCFGETEIEFVAYQPKSKEKAVYYLGQWYLKYLIKKLIFLRIVVMSLRLKQAE